MIVLLFREREGVKEAYNLFNEVADELFGPEDLQQDSGHGVERKTEKGENMEENLEENDSEEDIDAAFDKVSTSKCRIHSRFMRARILLYTSLQIRIKPS